MSPFPLWTPEPPGIHSDDSMVFRRVLKKSLVTTAAKDVILKSSECFYNFDSSP